MKNAGSLKLFCVLCVLLLFAIIISFGKVSGQLKLTTNILALLEILCQETVRKNGWMITMIRPEFNFLNDTDSIKGCIPRQNITAKLVNAEH